MSAVLPNGTLPTFIRPEREDQFLDTATKFILGLDGEDKLELITDMRRLNIRGNTDISTYELFWDYCGRALELENDSGAHHRRKAGVDEETTNNVSYAPGILSIPQLMRVTEEMLEKDDKARGVDYEVPSEKWLSLQLSPNNQFNATAAYCTGKLNFVRKMLSRSARDDSHPAAHWNSGMKKCWRHHMSYLLSLLEKHHTSASSLEVDDELMVPCELPRNDIIIAGCDDKSNIQVGDDVPLESTPRQSN